MTPEQIAAGLSKVESEAAALAGKAEAKLAPNLMGALEVASGWAPRLKVAASLAAIMLVVIIGVWLGVKVERWMTPQPVKEDVQAAPMQRLSASAVVAETDPETERAPPPPVRLPHGAVRQRASQIVARPAIGASSVEIDTSLVREGDKLKLYASSPDGTITSATDFPITPALLPPEPKKWAMGLGYTTEREVGVWVDRDVGRVRLGAEVLKGQKGARAELRVGVSF